MICINTKVFYHSISIIGNDMISMAADQRPSTTYSVTTECGAARITLISLSLNQAGVRNIRANLL
jgi:hypothetical protein